MSEAAVPRGLPSGPGAASLLSDERLVRRATQGDQRAFAAIFRRYHQQLYRFSLGIVGDPEDAQDALQNTMIKAMAALPGERRQIQLKPWLYRIAHNESIDLLRRRRETRELDPEAPAASPQPAEEAEQRARLRQLVSDMEELPDRQRGALVMRELAGLGFAEIGSALDTSPAVARQTLYEARLSLRQMQDGREMSCDSVMRALSDDDGRVIRRRDLRAHLRGCRDCRAFRDELRRRRSDFAAVAPLPAAAAAAILQSIFGAGGPGGGGIAGAAGGGLAKIFGGSVAAKSAATAAVVAAIGVTAADRGGLIDAGLPGDGGSQPTHSAPQSDAAGSAGAAAKVSAGDGVQAGRGSLDAAVRSPARGDLAAARAAAASRNADRGTAAAPVGETAAVRAPASPGGNSASHRQDAGRHGTPPAAAAHGQQTAAAHKAGKGGRGGGGTQAAHPAKPAHPVKPAHPSKPVTPAASAPAPGGEPVPAAPEGEKSTAESARRTQAPAPAPDE